MSVWMANVWRFADGKIVEWWLNMDTLGSCSSSARIRRWDRAGSESLSIIVRRV